MNRWECSSCNYKWVPKTNRTPNRCPYCSSPRIAETRKAQEFIDEL